MAGELDRAAVERILRRASEFEAAGEGGDADDEVIFDDRFDAEAIVAAGVEAGLGEVAIRRAVAVERLEQAAVTDDRRDGLVDRIVGPRTVVEERFVHRDHDEVVDALDTWLTGVHNLRRVRLDNDRDGGVIRGRWTRRTDMAASVQRTVRGLTGDGKLGEATMLTASVVEASDGTAGVRVEVERGNRRGWSAGAVAVSATATAALGAAGVVAAAPVGLLAVPAAVAGTAVAASSRSHARRLQNEVERLVSDVEHDVEPDGVIGGITKRISTKLQSQRR